ncbi:hypothetical protein Gorai_008971 [Gossypium raimondii]|uniref:Strictosidine synthase conserved region domain-containing protein n=1 Tax=Gossypium raimondii TaxID=29730 RepID=A0A7J8PSM5_GOSRA|nr:hypothetical protein [Gossypium raimondii]
MPSPAPHPKKRLCPFPLLLSTLFPLLAAVLVYQLDPFDPAPLPIHELGQAAMSVSLRNDRMLQGAELVGAGELLGLEDIAYDSKSHLIYTGCQDGRIKRVRLHHADSAVEKWVNTHDGVDVADNGMIYFTDASYKYSMEDSVWDVLEGKPHGRLMSFDPVTRKTRVLVTHLYFANGVAVSPRQNSLILCETTMRRCRKYYIEGNKQGEQEKFVDNLTGLPDNIKYDGEGHYWIALATGNSVVLDLALRYAFIRKAMGLMEKYIGGLSKGKNAGLEDCQRGKMQVS